MSTRDEEAAAIAIAAALQAHREAGLARFGFALPCVRVTTDAPARTLRLHGDVLARRFVPRILEVARRAAPAGWSVDGGGLRIVEGPWCSLLCDPTELLAAIPGRGRRAGLATELRPRSGPVQLLAEHDGFALLRAMDGTLGWTDSPLGAPVATPQITAPRRSDPHVFVTSARAYLGAPYRLGGTTAAGIDCSGLVQQALRDGGNRQALRDGGEEDGGVVPRHSRDQLAIDPRPGAGEDAAGTLVFVWTSAEAPCHVGIADGAGLIIHASRHRGVVADPREAVLRSATRCMHVPWASIVRLQARLHGAAALDDLMNLGSAPD